MELKGKKVGIALTGSFCTFDKIFVELEKLMETGAEVYTIFSDASQRITSRFGKPEDFMKRAEEITGRKIENEYYSTQVNGYTFIVLASEYDHTDMYVSPAQLAWLEAEMAKASQDGKPIFVISHWPVNASHGLPESWGDKEYDPDEGGMGDQSDAVAAILKKYKNVFLISGHIHLGFKNEGQLGRYTYSSVESDGSFHSINLPSYMYMTGRGRIANGTGYAFEVYDDEVVIRARSFSAGVWYSDYSWTIDLV